MAAERTTLFILCLAILVSSISVEMDHTLYHSASIFSLDYQEMLDHFRVFIYPRIEHAAAPDLRDDPRTGSDSVDRLFLELLGSSRFVTEDPDEAQLLLLPASVSALWRNGGSSSEKMIARSLKAYVQQVRDRFPYWQRALGADHVYISCQDFKSDWSRNILELKKNAIQLACFPLGGGEQELLPHKDITMPSKSMIKSHKAANKRVNLVFYSATEHEIIPNSWRTDHQFVYRRFNESKYLPALQSTNFCLSLSPRDRQLVLDSLRSGCIPVIFASGRLSELPFQDILEWREFAIVLRHDQLHETKLILESIDEASRSRLRENGALAAKHMEWNSPPRLHDAFHMVLYQLWRRHYVVRYADRTRNFL